MPVPEGLAGMRVDAGLSRLLGLSRTAAAALAEDGSVELDGVAAGKSDRLAAGAWLEVRLPEPPAPLENTPVEIEGMTILYSDDDIVAVDKPAGVAAHASVGWTGPTVLGGLAAAGYRITTSGVHERQASCIASTSAPPEPWWSRSPSGRTPCSSARSSSARSTSVTTRWCKDTRIRPAARSMRRSAVTAAMTGSSPSPQPAGTA